MLSDRQPFRNGEEGWEGPIFLPGSRLFFGRLRGHTLVYPFGPADAVFITPSRENGALQALLACLGTASAGEKIVHQLKGEHDYSLICPCEFGRSLGGPGEGSYGALDSSGGMDIIFGIAPNEETPFARINLTAGIKGACGC